jgi:hypothetical protein
LSRFRTIEQGLELTTSYYLDINSTNDTIDIPIPDIIVSPPVVRILRKIFRTYNPYCWRRSYGRGVGRPLHTCPDHSPDQSGLLCYPSCRNGYNGVGPLCWEQCENITSFGFACLDIRLSNRSCPWYDTCGITRSSCVSCPTNYSKLGCLCGRFYLRSSYSRGIGSSLTCSKSYEHDGALCYDKCDKRYNGVGPVCWQHCPSTHPFSCLAGCSITKEICQRKVVDMVQSVIGSSLTILNLVIGIPLISLKTLDILSNAAKHEWLLVARDMTAIAGQLADQILPEIAKKFLNWSFGTVQSATKNASFILTAAAMKDQNILLPFLKFVRLDSIDLAFNHGQCELPDDDDDLEFI